MYKDLTKGKIIPCLIIFSLPMILGNMLQQLYNIIDSIIVGKFISNDALASVGSAYALMVFLTSIFLGLSLGSGVVLSIAIGKKNETKARKIVGHSFILIMFITIILNIVIYLFIDQILFFLKIPQALFQDMKTYLIIIFGGLLATSLYNYLAAILRAIGNSLTPLIFLAGGAILNIILDLYFIIVLKLGIAGAAYATIIAQYFSALTLLLYSLKKYQYLIPKNNEHKFDKSIMKEIINLSFLTCLQQSTMNFGILLIQRLVDSFGAITMAGFAAAVKIDSFAYLPVQDFGNAFSTFVAQNYGANDEKRLKDGLKYSVILSLSFAFIISIIVNVFAKELLSLFIKDNDPNILEVGINYLRIEGSFYIGIALLFLLYGFYRALKKPGMSIILTVISLGLRVVIAYSFVHIFNEFAIYISIPIGWIIADAFGIIYYMINKRKLLKFK